MISIVVPVYNVEKYIDKCIKSLINQTYKEIEILLIDDGSKDNSLSKCVKWGESDARIRVIHQKNQGVSSARNRGIEEANGEYIMFVDSDDYIDINMVEILIDKLIKENADISICGYIEEKLNGEIIKEVCLEDKINYSSEEEKLLINWAPWCKLYTKEIIQNVEFPNVALAEDLMFNVNIICKNHINKIAITNKALYHYISRMDSATSVQYSDVFRQGILMEKECIEKLSNANIKIDYKKIKILYNGVVGFYNRVALIAKEKGKYKSAYEEVRNIVKEHRKFLLQNMTKGDRLKTILICFVPIIYIKLFRIKNMKKFIKMQSIER